MASPFDRALGDVLDALFAATRELEGAREPGDVAQRSAELALGLSRSTHAVASLGDKQFVAGRDPGHSASHTAELRAQGRSMGAITVRRPAEYTDRERTALEVFASHVALALIAAEPRSETAASLRRVERAHEEAVHVLQAVSANAVQGRDLGDFYRRLARTVGEHVGANRVLLWRLGDDHMLTPRPGGYHIDEAMFSGLQPARCEPGGSDLASRVVFDDFVFRASEGNEPLEHAYVLEILGVKGAIAAPWRAGDERLGLIAAYDSTRAGGFSREDTWVLQKAGLAAGLVALLWQSQDDLRRSVERLTKVDSARQLLLKNMTTVVERERKRVVSELHDDALQKLTAAELQLARLAADEEDGPTLEKVRELLEATESALRRLVFEVHPPSLESPDGLAQSIRERVAMLDAEGIKTEVTLELPEDLDLDLRTMVFRQVAEAIGNVERHSGATKVDVRVKLAGGGVLGVVHDNGRGFVVAERANLPGHLGLLALRERALMAGGRYQIDSRPGGGTRVEFWIPIDQ
jgi:signal transduction histidine kinase